jgi:cyclopropane fatty-acyl-phospholipid synthase-like methyltransferase
MMPMNYEKASKYPDLKTIYAQCSGPGGLKLTEFMADKLNLQPGMVVLDVGFNRGYQTCFLAKEYSVFAVGIDPWKDRKDNRPHIEHLMDNARTWGVAHRVLGVQVGLPDTKFASGSYDAIYTTTTLEMIRGLQGEAMYRRCIGELYRLLVPGGLLALGEPMHFDVPVPPDLAAVLPEGDASWTKCFSTIDKTRAAVQSKGFKILEAAYAPDARAWWEEYACYDPDCIAKPQEDARAIQIDAGRWLSFGYVIAQKPELKK